MCLKPEAIDVVPEETSRIAHAAYPKSNIYLQLRDEFGAIYKDEQFVELYPRRGQPAQAPWRLALVSVMQFREGLSDRQAADAVRGRLDWKYLLGLELGDPGFDHSVLVEFRQRLLTSKNELLIFDLFLMQLRERGYLKMRGQQRTDSTHVLAKIRSLNRVEGVGETFRAALNSLAVVAPSWLKEQWQEAWIERYEHHVEGYRLPDGKQARDAYALLIGQDGANLLDALYADTTPGWLREIPAVQTLRGVWVQNFSWEEGDLHWRDLSNAPAAGALINSPYDPEALFAQKRETQWVGYKVHLTETEEFCDILFSYHLPEQRRGRESDLYLLCGKLARLLTLGQPVDYTEIKEAIMQNLSEEDSKGLDDVKGRVIKHFVNLENPAITLQSWRHEPMKEKVIESLKNKNLTVMCGAGKDSEFVLTIARIIQLMLLEEYGATFTLRVGIGRQPGMIDVYDNLEHCFDALGLKGDELADLFFIDGKATSPYRKDYPIPEHMIALNRNRVLMNGHIFGGAGRRTFCDDCNKMLGGWIATALVYKDGADLFMTGDSPQELRNQIRMGAREMAARLKIPLPEQGNLTDTQYALHMLKAIGDEHSRIISGDNAEDIEERSIDAEAVPERTRFVSTFSRKMPYASKNRVEFLTNFLNFSFDSLMFSFTESDCGNPALMCHLYGLIAEHAYKDVQDEQGNSVTYTDGIRGYVKYGIEKNA